MRARTQPPCVVWRIFRRTHARCAHTFTHSVHNTQRWGHSCFGAADARSPCCELPAYAIVSTAGRLMPALLLLQLLHTQAVVNRSISFQGVGARGLGLPHPEALEEEVHLRAVAMAPLPFLHEDGSHLVGYLPANDRGQTESHDGAPGQSTAPAETSEVLTRSSRRKRSKRLAQRARGAAAAHSSEPPSPPPPPAVAEGATAATETRRRRQRERALFRRASQWVVPEDASSEHEARPAAKESAGAGECRLCGAMSKGSGGGGTDKKDLNCCHRGGSWYGKCGKGKGLRHTFRDGWRACNTNRTRVAAS